jgi:hypothetical protein
MSEKDLLLREHVHDPINLLGTIRAPPKLKSITAVCAPKVQKPIRVFSLKIAISFLALAIGFFGAYFFPVIGDILPDIIHAPENCLVFLILLSNMLKFSFLPSCFNFPEYLLDSSFYALPENLNLFLFSPYCLCCSSLRP